MGGWIGVAGERAAGRYPAVFHVVAVFFLIELAEMFHEAREYTLVLKRMVLGTF